MSLELFNMPVPSSHSPNNFIELWTGERKAHINAYCLQLLTEETDSDLLKSQQPLIANEAEMELELDLIPKELSPVVWAGPLHFYLLHILSRSYCWAKSGQAHWLYTRHDEEAAEIKEASLAAERGTDDAKFKRRERSVKAAYLLSVPLPKRSVTVF